MCTLDRSYSKSHRRWAGPGDRQGGWWLSLPLGIINGRVAGRQFAEHHIFSEYAERMKNTRKGILFFISVSKPQRENFVKNQIWEVYFDI